MKQNQGAYLARTGNDPREILPSLVLSHGLHDARVIGPQVDETMRDTGFPDRLQEGERCCVHVGQHFL